MVIRKQIMPVFVLALLSFFVLFFLNVDCVSFYSFSWKTHLF